MFHFDNFSFKSLLYGILISISLFSFVFLECPIGQDPHSELALPPEAQVIPLAPRIPLQTARLEQLGQETLPQLKVSPSLFSHRVSRYRVNLKVRSAGFLEVQTRKKSPLLSVFLHRSTLGWQSCPTALACSVDIYAFRIYIYFPAIPQARLLV